MLSEPIESRLAAALRKRYGLEEPEVRVHSGRRAALLAGRPDLVEVSINRLDHEDLCLRDVKVRSQDIKVSVPEFIRGSFEDGVRNLSSEARIYQGEINGYLRRNGVRPEGKLELKDGLILYYLDRELFGLPVSATLELRVLGPCSVRAVPTGLSLGGARVSSRLLEYLPSLVNNFTFEELPLGLELRDLESVEGALIVRAAREPEREATYATRERS